MKAVAITTAFVLCCSSSYGQDVAEGREDRQPPPEISSTTDLSMRGPAQGAAEDLEGLDVLFQLVGRWEVDELYPKTDDAPEGGTGEGRASYKKALDNTHVIGDYRSRCKDLGFDVEGHAVFVYDEQQSAYLYWWFDNYGARSLFEGDYDAERRSIVFSREDPGTEGETIKHIHTFQFRSDGSIKLTMQVNAGGRRAETILTSTLYKKGSKPGEEEEQDQPRAPKKAKVVRGI